MAVRYKYALPAENPPVPGLAKKGEFINMVSDDVTKDVRGLIAAFHPGMRPNEVLILDVSIEER